MLFSAPLPPKSPAYIIVFLNYFVQLTLWWYSKNYVQYMNFFFVSSVTSAGMMKGKLSPLDKDNIYNRAIISGSEFIVLRTSVV
jgi:hypothetical protein